MADEEVYRLRQAMDAAVEADKLAIEEQRPAIEKLKMLNEVIAVLQKSVAADSKVQLCFKADI